MMIKVDGKPEINYDAKEAKYSFFADAKSEVTDAMTGAVGMLPGLSIAQGSTVITADAEFAFMKSDGSWNWVGEDE